MINSSSIWFCCCIAISSSVFASNQSSPLEQLESMVSTWPRANTQLWVNSRIDNPDVLVGENIYFSVQSEVEASYVLFVLDSSNQISIIKPKNSAYWHNDTYGMTFPALPEGCNFPVNSNCERVVDVVEAELPAGHHEVFAIATDKPLPNTLLEMESDADFYFLGSSQADITKLLNALYTYVNTNSIPFDIVKRAFNVNGEVLADLEVFRNIQKYNSPVIAEYMYQRESTAPDVQNTVAELIGVRSNSPFSSTELNSEGDEQSSIGSVTFTRGTTTLDSAGRDQLQRIGRLAQAKKRAEENIAITIVSEKKHQTKNKLTFLREETVKNYLKKRFLLQEKELQLVLVNIEHDERVNADLAELEKVGDDGIQVILLSQ